MSRQKEIGRAKVPTAKEASICRKWGRVRCSQNEMLGLINVGQFGYGVCAPKEKYNMISMLTDCSNDGIRKIVPPESRMSMRTRLLYRKGGVKEKHSLSGKSGQIRMQRDRSP